MNLLGRHCCDWLGRAGRLRGFAVVSIATAFAAGCEQPFEPYEENERAIFSMFGYLDLRADTHWIRVMPVRQNLFLDPEPIDAVVTLEHLGNGRTVTLKDSLFQYVDPRLNAVAYAHNFWTTERLEPKAAYRLRATRSDGLGTEATVGIPDEFEFTFRNDVRTFPDSAEFEIRAEHVVFVEVIYGMGRMVLDALTGDSILGGPAASIRVRDNRRFSTGDAGTHGIGVTGYMLFREGLRDVRRQEIRVAVARSDWPYHAGLPDLEVTLPGKMPSNVERGFGFVGGVATRTIPFHRCLVLEPSANRASPCTIRFDARSASITGRVVRQPCGTPHLLADVRLTERFAGGGAVIRSWKTGWDGDYRFEGIEAAAELVLDLGPGTPQVKLPRLAPGEQLVVEDMTVGGRC